MSLRELALHARVEALENAVQGLALALRNHLPATAGIVDGYLSDLFEADKAIKHTTARAVTAQRTNYRLGHDTPLSYNDLAVILAMYLPVIETLDESGVFFKAKAVRWNSTKRECALDMTGILAEMPLGHNRAGAAMNLELTFLKKDGIRDIGLAGTEYYQGEPVSYWVEYNPEVVPLFEKETIRQMNAVVKALGGTHHFPDINLNLNRRCDGVNKAYADWTQQPEHLGEAGNVTFVRLDAVSADDRTQITVVFSRDNPLNTVDIVVRQKFDLDVRLVVKTHDGQFSLYEGRPPYARLDYSGLSLRTRLRLHALIEYVILELTGGMFGVPFVDITQETLTWTTNSGIEASPEELK